MTAAGPAVLVDSIHVDDGAPMGPFARALRTGSGDALAFLPAPPRDDDAWREHLRAARAATAPIPAPLAERLAARQAALGAGERAERNARRLAERGTLAVVTGQQPGLFGGPLLTFHKAAGAVALARRLDALGEAPVVPVFWLAGEDHDFEEANRAVVVDRRGQARALRVDAAGDGRSIQDLDIPRAHSDAVVAALVDSLPETDRAAAAARLARREGGEDFATWSVRVLLRLFGDCGLVVVEPAQLESEVGGSLAWLLDNAEAIRAAVDETGAALRAAGLQAPIGRQPDGATALFYRSEPGGRRLRVALDADGRVRLRDEPSALTRATLRERLLADPASGSGNVIGRVFVQNRHLPVLAYVAGPSEIAYQAQVRAAHEAVGLRFPLALPRPEATWLDRKIQAGLDAFGVGVQQVLAGAEAPRLEATQETEAALQALAGHLDALPAEVAALLETRGRGAEAFGRALDRLRAEWAKAGPRIRAAFEADAGVGRARWERIMSWLRPLGRPQERTLSPLALVARHGIEAVREGLRSLDPLAPVHYVLRLGEENPPS